MRGGWRGFCSFVAIAGVLCAAPCRAQSAEPGKPPVEFDPYYLGYGTEPAMDSSVRIVSSVDAGLCRAFGLWAGTPKRKRWLAPVWEVPMALLWSTTLHEIGGHGGRAREYGLDPSYGISFDLSAWTSLGKVPETNEQIIVISGGGTEADGTLAHRLTLDLLSPKGIEGSKIPMLLMGKIDFSLYVAIISDPREDPSDFTKQYTDGYDPAIWLVSRQGQRVGADPAAIWEGTYSVDVTDPMLSDNHDALRAAAIWNLLDPALTVAMIGYFRAHLDQGETRVKPWTIPAGEHASIMFGTRAFMETQDVSRYLDVYVSTPWGVGTVYGRDLDSSVERTWGFGLGWQRAQVAEGIELSAQWDRWDFPRAAEGLETGSGWNASVELDAVFRRKAGVSVVLGKKSDGFLPGLPTTGGTYVQVGALVAF